MTVGQLKRILAYLPTDAEVVLRANGEASADGYRSVTAVSLVNLCPVTPDEAGELFVKTTTAREDGRAPVPAAVIACGAVRSHVRDI